MNTVENEIKDRAASANGHVRKYKVEDLVKTLGAVLQVRQA